MSYLYERGVLTGGLHSDWAGHEVLAHKRAVQVMAGVLGITSHIGDALYFFELKRAELEQKGFADCEPLLFSYLTAKADLRVWLLRQGVVLIRGTSHWEVWRKDDETLVTLAREFSERHHLDVIDLYVYATREHVEICFDSLLRGFVRTEPLTRTVTTRFAGKRDWDGD